MARCLVTGAAGFIGSRVARRLASLGHEVLGFDNFSGGGFRPVEMMEGDITDHEKVNLAFLTFGPDYVFHFAAYAAEGLSPYIRRFNYINNVVGSINLINASIRWEIKRFVFASSAAVYGDRQDGRFNSEDEPVSPGDPYAIAKRTVEMDIHDAGRRFGLPFTILRLHNVYGSGQNLFDPYRNVAGIFILKALEGKPLPLFGDGGQLRQFTFIDDILDPICSLINDESTEDFTINLGSDPVYSIRDLGQEINVAFERDSNLFEFIGERKEAWSVIIDHSRMKALFPSYRPTPLKTGIGTMIDWAVNYKLMDNPRAHTKLPDIEIERDLPEAWKKLKEG